MGIGLLKKARKVVSLLFFFLITFLFIDFGNTFSFGLIEGVLFFQFVPSLLKFIQLSALIFTGFFVVLILTLLFGRVYCSFLCPVGTLQDIFIVIAKKFKKRKLFKFQPPKNTWRYGVLVIVILFLVFGSIFSLNLLDPYSLYGKIASTLIRPVYYTLNNVAVSILEQFQNYTLFLVSPKSYSWISFGYSSFFVMLIGWLVYKHGRLYCNTVCPVGTALGLISRISWFKIKLHQTLCTSCGVCGANCKAECIDTKNKTVDFSRCIGCMDCLTVCPSGGVLFSYGSSIKKVDFDKKQSNKRRQFIKHSVAIPAGILLVSKKSFSEGMANGKIPVNKEYPVIPPGALSLTHFNNSCTACHLCVSACPTRVIQPSLLEYGIFGILQPRMDFHTSFCNFECTICSEICPTGAILPIETEQKKLTQLGISKFIKENCIVYTDEKDCGACSEHCPTKAVNMVFYKNDLKIPEVKDDICIGCGACEYACPTTPKSIYVEGNPIHKLAKKPVEVEIETIVDPEDDFPF